MKKSLKTKPKHHYDPQNKRTTNPLDFLYRVSFNIDNTNTDSYILYNLAFIKHIKGLNDFIEIFLTKLFKFWPHHHLLDFVLKIMKRDRQIAIQMYFLLKNRPSFVEGTNKKILMGLRDYLLKSLIDFYNKPTFSLTYDKLITDSLRYYTSPIKTTVYEEEDSQNHKKTEFILKYEDFLKRYHSNSKSDNKLNSDVPWRGKTISRFYEIPKSNSQSLDGCLIHLAVIPSLLMNQVTPLNYRNIFYNIPSENHIPSLRQNIFTQSILLIEKLAEISNKLKFIDIPFRQDLLEIELELLNYSLTEDLFIFNSAKGLDFNTCKVMDSAKNVPFKLSFTASNYITTVSNMNKYKVDLELKESFLRQIYKLYKENTLEAKIIVDKLIEQLRNRKIKIEVIQESSNEAYNSVNTQGTLSNISEESSNTSRASFNNSDTFNNPNDIPKDVEVLNNLTVKEEVFEMSVESEFISSSYIPLNEVNPQNINIVKTIIIKSGDLIQEQFCIAFMKILNTLFNTQSLNLKLFPYEIFFINSNYGYVEFLENTLSIHTIKTNHGCLTKFYDKFENPILAKKKFLNSFTAYCLFTYLLQVKDRHNGNILIDVTTGNLMHIDFGFILGQHPGVWLVESAPFKFTYEYSKIININEFKYLFLEGFKVLRKEIDFINRHFKSYGYGKCCGEIRDRLFIGLGEKEMEDAVIGLIDEAYGNIRTGAYDSIQFYSEGYMK